MSVRITEQGYEGGMITINEKGKRCYKDSPFQFYPTKELFKFNEEGSLSILGNFEIGKGKVTITPIK